MYQFKSMPRASSEQFLLPPRDRIVPDGQSPGEPEELSLEDAERLSEKRAKKWAERDSDAGHYSGPGKSFGTQQDEYSDNRDENRAQKDDHESSNSQDISIVSDADPWAKWKNKSKH